MGLGAWASETGGSLRPVYDTLLLWANFVILVFLLAKFGRDPIRRFFTSQKAEIAQSIERIEAEKKAIDGKMAGVKKRLEGNHLHLADVKSRIIQQGEKKRQQILADAQQQSSLMLEDAERRVERMISEAKESMKSELIEAAAGLVEERLPSLLTKEDQHRYVDQFLSDMSSR